MHAIVSRIRLIPGAISSDSSGEGHPTRSSRLGEFLWNISSGDKPNSDAALLLWPDLYLRRRELRQASADNFGRAARDGYENPERIERFERGSIHELIKEPPRSGLRSPNGRTNFATRPIRCQGENRVSYTESEQAGERVREGGITDGRRARKTRDGSGAE